MVDQLTHSTNITMNSNENLSFLTLTRALEQTVTNLRFLQYFIEKERAYSIKHK